MSKLIKLNTLDDIKKVTQIASSYSFDIDAGHNKYIVDLKSIMGVLSLSLDKPIMVVPITDNEGMINQLFLELSPWCVLE